MGDVMRKAWLLVVLIFVCPSVFAQMLPQGITPQMLQQVQAMSPEQQRALAEQYGITLPGASGNSSVVQSPDLAQPGVPMQPQLPRDSASLMNYPNGFMWIQEDEESGPRRFGQDLFNQRISTFAATDNASVPNSYRLGVGDQLIVHLFGKENEEFTLQIGRDGSVAFPRLGSVVLGGLTFEDAGDLIASRVSQQLIGVESAVSMGRLRAIDIFLAGEVRVPGAHSVSALTTVTQALFQAGGVSDIGSLRNIQVKRGAETVASFDAYDLLLRGDASRDIRLQSGDVIFVPPFEAVAEVVGEVKRPMLYELKGGETISDLLAMSGSYTQYAFPSLAVLSRRAQSSGLASAISLNLLDSATQALPVDHGDLLRVPTAGETLSNVITLNGAVHRPGDYGWFKGMRVSTLLRSVRNDLLREADLSYALLVRYKNQLLDISVKQFSLVNAISSPGSSQDPVLEEFDELIVFSLPEMEGFSDRLQHRQRKTAQSGRSSTSTDMSRSKSKSPTARRAENQEDSNGTDGPTLAEMDQSQTDQRTDLLETADKQAAARYDDIGTTTVRDNSRDRLLAPIIAKLRAQAREEQPVQIVSISGAVRVPGTYPLTEDATLADLLSAAGGLKDSAYIKAAEFRRLREVRMGEITAQYEEVNLADVFRDPTKFSLQSRDHLTVREIPDWSPNDRIIISGEVAFPGTYLIQPGETLRDVVERAGGLTAEAFPEAAVFTRLEIAKREAERAKEFAANIRKNFASSLLTEETANSSLAEIKEVTETLESFEGQGRMLIDLPLALSGDIEANVVVLDGDALTIPKRVNTVTVVGEVYQQGTHTFDNNTTLEEYLSLSAGFTSRADESAMYVVKANGSVVKVDASWWRFAGAEQNLAPGDTIVVPVDTQYRESLAQWREVTQIVYQSLVALAVVVTL